MNPAKAMIMRKLADCRLDLKSLSKDAGRNDSYLQQFIQRDVPKKLPEDVKALIASRLNIPIEVLSGDLSGRLSGNVPSRAKPVKALPTKAEAPAVRSPFKQKFLNRGSLVAVFDCPGDIDELCITDWVERPAHYAGAGPMLAIWVSTSSGRLREGDLAFVRPGQPAKFGDMILVTQGKRAVAIGEMTHRTGTSATIQAGTSELSFKLSAHCISRIAVAVLR